ncbi:MAG: hypothetical protein AAF962_15310 [Actinomycetota bacterium]
MTTDGLFLSPASTRQDGAGQGFGDPTGVASATIGYIVDRLHNRLRLLLGTYGLSRREILRVQDGVARLARDGMAPTGNDFWAWTAQPRAQVLIDRATEAIEDELSLLIAELAFAAPMVGSRPPGAPGRGSVGEVDLAGRVLPLLPRSTDLDQLGWWWQRRLRRAALIRALPALLAGTTADIGLTISRVEMQLLDQAPWVHGDRLLSAFELAYAEIERLGTARVREAQDRLHLAAGGRLALRL